MLVNRLWDDGMFNADNHAWLAMEAFLLQNNPLTPALGWGGTKLNLPFVIFKDLIDPSSLSECSGLGSRIPTIELDWQLCLLVFQDAGKGFSR
jgi:hypothetical protein